MGSDVNQLQETQLHPPSAKVHLAICTKLMRLTNRISSIFPDIEAARPSYTSGIKSLALLQKAIDKANALVQNCCKSSKLYLALTGDTIVARFEQTRKLLQQSLRQLQSMIPTNLEFQVLNILNNIKDTVFFLDFHEDEAGKALRALLQQNASLVNYGGSEVEVLQFAAVRLHLTSQKDLLIERRSIKKLLSEVEDDNSTKSIALGYLLYLLKKYDKQILEFQLSENFNCKSSTTGFIPPEEFLCPLSSRLMFDPVIISSGQTFERNSIQKWLEKGHDVCPRTGMKLFDLSLTPNSVMRDMIFTWSVEHGITLSDPCIQTSRCPSIDEASSSSISSTASSLKDLHHHMHRSNKLFGSIRELSDDDGGDASYNFQFFYDIDEIKSQLLSNLGGIPWESQSKAVQDVKYYLKFYNPSCAFVNSENFEEPLVQFLKASLDKHDVEAQKAGCQLFLTFLRANRKETHVSKDVYSLLASFLETEATEESLNILELLSNHLDSLPNIATSTVLSAIIAVLNHPNRDFQQTAISTLHNLSLIIETSSCKLLASDWIPKLIPFLEDKVVGSTCIVILENLCKIEEARVSIARTEGCIASIIELLEMGSSEDQEHAAGILLSLCAQKEEYCHLVLHEGIVPSLCHVSVNGNKKAMARASELLRILRELKYEDEEEEAGLSNDHASNHKVQNKFEQKEKKFSFGRKMKMFKNLVPLRFSLN